MPEKNISSIENISQEENKEKKEKTKAKEVYEKLGEKVKKLKEKESQSQEETNVDDYLTRKLEQIERQTKKLQKKKVEFKTNNFGKHSQLPENFAEFKIYEEVFKQQKNIFSYLKSLIEEENSKHSSFWKKTLISFLGKIPDLSNKPAYELPQYIIQKTDSLLSKWYIPNFFKKGLKTLRKKMEKVSNNLRETHYFIENGELFNTDTIWLYSNNPKELEKYGGHKAKDKLGETLGYNQITTREKFVDFLNKNADKIGEINSKGLADYVTKSFIKANKNIDKTAELISSELNLNILKKLANVLKNILLKEMKGNKTQLHQLIDNNGPLGKLIDNLENFSNFKKDNKINEDYNFLSSNLDTHQNQTPSIIKVNKDFKKDLESLKNGKVNSERLARLIGGFLNKNTATLSDDIGQIVTAGIIKANKEKQKNIINKLDNLSTIGVIKNKEIVTNIKKLKEIIEKRYNLPKKQIDKLFLSLKDKKAFEAEVYKIFRTKKDAEETLGTMKKFYKNKQELYIYLSKLIESLDTDKANKLLKQSQIEIIIGGKKITKINNSNKYSVLNRLNKKQNNLKKFISDINKAAQLLTKEDNKTFGNKHNYLNAKTPEEKQKILSQMSKEEQKKVKELEKADKQFNQRYETVYLPSQQEKQKETKKNTSKQENNSNTSQNKEENSDNEPDPHQETLSYKSVDGLIQLENPFLQKNNKNLEQKEIIQANSIEDANKKLLKIGLENFGFVKIENIHFPKFTQDTINKLGFDITKPLSKEEIKKGQQLLTIQFLHTIESGNKKLTDLQKEIIKEIKNDLKTKPFSEDIFTKLLNFINDNPELISNIYDISTNTLKIENLKNTNSIEFEKIKKEYI